MKLYMDEAWRGPLYWPLHIGLVSNPWISEKELKKHKLFQDSKTLSPKKREEAFNEITELEKNGKLIISIGTISSKIIDDFWVTRAINIAVSKALYKILSKLLWKKTKKIIKIKEVNNLSKEYEQKYEPIEIIFDWKTDFWIGKDLGIKTSTIVHWDATCVQISIASILAKVSRDKILDNVALNYPEYWFEKHKGYGTKLHYEAIETHWVLKEHRKLFLKKIFPNRKIQKYDYNTSFSIN